MHVLITGGAGFIGSHLVERMLAEGNSVHVVDDLSTGKATNLAPFLEHPRFRFCEADIVTWDGISAAAQWSDRIYHLAAVVGVRRVLEDPIQVLATNIAGTERLLRAVVTGGWRPRIIIASSSEAYGFAQDEAFNEQNDLVFRAGGQTRWAYAVTKLVDEHLAHAFFKKRELPVTTVRLFNTVGPRQLGRYGMVLPNFVKQAVRGVPITVFGDGLQTRSFCDVRDTVCMLDELGRSEAAVGEIVNVGDDKEISIKDLAALVRERAGSQSPIKLVSYVEAYGESFEDVTHRRPDLTKLRSLITYSPKRSLTETIDDLIRIERTGLGHSASK